MGKSPKQPASTGATVRAFIAFKLPEDIKMHLHRIQSELKKENWSIKWVHPENVHLTLKFLGDIPESWLSAISQAMQAASGPFVPPKLSASGLGAFPSVKRPRVIWCGVAGDLEVLGNLHHSLESELAAFGFEKEGRRFKGHLTLGRVKGRVNPEALVDAVSRYGQVVSRAFVCDCLYLYQSRLSPAGPEYRELARVPVGAGQALDV